MTAPTPIVRAVTYERDGFRCVSCGRPDQLSYQHRQAVGMGGSKRRPQLGNGVTSCVFCNPRYESGLQSMALRFGWKVPRWVVDPTLVPMYYVGESCWYRISSTGAAREPITDDHAQQMMREVYGDTFGQTQAVADASA